MTVPTPDPTGHPPRGVPEELMLRLRDATQRLTDARKFLEQILDAPDAQFEHRAQATRRLREAEEQIERTTEEVNRFLAS
jgi:hypothetical protein